MSENAPVEIDIETWREAAQTYTTKTMREVTRLLDEGREQEAADIIDLRFGNTGEYRSAFVLYCFYDKFKNPEILFNLIISVYINDGYKFPKSVMIRAKKIAPTIPEADRLKGLPEGDTLTVYRATSEPISSKAKNGLSWTTNKNVAIWFGYRNVEVFGGAFREHATPLHIYTGTISRKKIIAYTNDRREFEVIQHGSVKDISELHPTEEEVQEAMNWHCNED